MDIIGPFFGTRNGVVRCMCNLNYLPTDPEDTRDHSRHHDKFLRVTSAKNHTPACYEVRERLKEEGHALLRGAVNSEQFTAASEMIVRALYDRSFDEAIQRGFGDAHPLLPEYSRMIAEDGAMSDPRANAALLRKYSGTTRPSGVQISTVWEP